MRLPPALTEWKLGAHKVKGEGGGRGEGGRGKGEGGRGKEEGGREGEEEREGEGSREV